MMNDLWTLFNYFIFLYPFYMSLLWTISGLIFFLRRERKDNPSVEDPPPFSIIIPAHNEEGNIQDTIESLSNLDYPSFEVIVVNDGSTDRTAEILDRLLVRFPDWLRVVHQEPNSGKSRALNTGLLVSNHELVLVMDADCYLSDNALREMVWHFVKSPRVGAVTGNPRILNRTTLLGKIQVGEYSCIIGLIKRSQRLLGKVLTVSGVMAAYRKSALLDCGLFDADTVTEDIDITWKLQKMFWDIRYEPRALSWILTPESIRGLARQRIRWAQGGVEVLKKHINVWKDWRYRRFWPIYIEYVASIFWSFAFVFLLGTWAATSVLSYLDIIDFVTIQPFIPPKWTGSVLASVCLIQFIASLYIDLHYERAPLMRYYFWIIWYPLFYWIINAMAVLVGVFNVFFRRGGVTVRWKSPDRGYHTLKS